MPQQTAIEYLRTKLLEDSHLTLLIRAKNLKIIVMKMKNSA
jgi:hypothetical protein